MPKKNAEGFIFLFMAERTVEILQLAAGKKFETRMDLMVVMLVLLNRELLQAIS